MQLSLDRVSQAHENLTNIACEKKNTQLHPILSRMKTGVFPAFALLSLMWPATAKAQPPTPSVVESPNVKVLTGLFAQQFQEEMNLMVQGLGMTCNSCHVRNNFASEEKRIRARQGDLLHVPQG